VTRILSRTVFVALATGLLTVVFLFTRFPFDRRAPTAIDVLVVVAVGALAAYGVSRFGRPPRPWVRRLNTLVRRAPRHERMPWERVSGELRSTFTQAYHLAVDLHHNYIGTEHVLLALARGNDASVRSVLEDVGAPPQDVARSVDELLTRGPEVISGEIGFTPRAKRSLEMAFDESRRVHDPETLNVHLLVGLALVADSIAAGVLRTFGATPPTLRAAIARRRSSPAGNGG
jgi:hypothetical protein